MYELNKLPVAPAGKTSWPGDEERFLWPTTMSDGRPWPRISIVTLSYNQAKFIEQAIRSVLHQGYPNLEYIVIDGGSTDVSVDIIEKYADCLAYWCSERDAGPAAGLNKGFQHATGEIFGFLNADDFYLPGSLHRIANLFRTHSSADVLCGDGYMTDVLGQARKPIYSDAWSLWRLA
jgi:glycosyltransferase involved in cell wall biosynthesis